MGCEDERTWVPKFYQVMLHGLIPWVHFPPQLKGVTVKEIISTEPLLFRLTESLLKVQCSQIMKDLDFHLLSIYKLLYIFMTIVLVKVGGDQHA